MEGNKKVSSSSSSFTSELFGSRDSSSSSSSSSGLFGSIFAPNPSVLGRGTIRYEGVCRKQNHPKTEALNSKLDDTYKSGEGERRSTPVMDYYDQRVHPLSSSIYYGGQDIYTHPVNSQGYSTTSFYKKDGTDDDSGSASRGNWWQGSLYY